MYAWCPFLCARGGNRNRGGKSFCERNFHVSFILETWGENRDSQRAHLIGRNILPIKRRKLGNLPVLRDLKTNYGEVHIKMGFPWKLYYFLSILFFLLIKFSHSHAGRHSTSLKISSLIPASHSIFVLKTFSSILIPGRIIKKKLPLFPLSSSHRHRLMLKVCLRIVCNYACLHTEALLCVKVWKPFVAWGWERKTEQASFKQLQRHKDW